MLPYETPYKIFLIIVFFFLNHLKIILTRQANIFSASFTVSTPPVFVHHSGGCISAGPRDHSLNQF